MGSVEKITDVERSEAIASGQRFLDMVVGEGTGFVSPNARVGTLSQFEKRKLVEGVVSGWIIKRAEQLVSDRLDEAFFLASGLVPDPYELGACALALPALGELVDKMGLNDKAIGEWSKDQILQFVFTATELVNEARAARDERPGPAPQDLSDSLMMAG